MCMFRIACSKTVVKSMKHVCACITEHVCACTAQVKEEKESATRQAHMLQQAMEEGQIRVQTLAQACT
jgi:hypothetical protein